jgi:hypothetical protein
VLSLFLYKQVLTPKNFQSTNSTSSDAKSEEVEIEQERELALEVEHEVEKVREAQQPPRFHALPTCKVQADIEKLSRSVGLSPAAAR